MGLVQLFRVLGDSESKFDELASSEFIPEYACVSLRLFMLICRSHGTVRSTVDAHHRRREIAHYGVLSSHCLDWTKVAHWIYRAEQVQLGNEGELHPAIAENYAQLHLECCPV